MKRVVVVGGGIAGLASAYRIRQAAAEAGLDLDLRLIERDARCGGKIGTRAEEGYRVEVGPNGFLDNEPATLRLVKDLGLQERLQRSSDAARKRFLYRDGRLHLLEMNPVRFMKSPLLSRRARLRMVAEWWQKPRPAGVHEETVGDFGRRRLGREFTEIFLDSMVSGIYAGDVDRLSVDAAFPKVVEMEATYGGLLKAMITRQKERKAELRRKRREAREKGTAAPDPDAPENREVQAGPSGVLHSFRHGMSEPIDALVEALGSRVVRCGAGVSELTPYGPRGGWRLSVEGETLDADAVVLALPSHTMASLLRSVAPESATALDGIPFAGVHVVALGYRREQVGHSLDGFGALIPRREGLRTLGSLWTSSIYPERAPEGHVLIRNMIGGAHDPESSELSEEELLAIVRREMEPLYRVSGEPAFTRVYKWARGIPQYELGHPGRVEAARQGLRDAPGLFLTGNSLVGISFNYCVAHAETVAAEVVAHLRQGADSPSQEANA